MERDYSRGRSLISFPFHWINFKLDHIIDLGVSGEAQHNLIQNIFKHKVLIIVGSCQLDVFENQFIDYVIRVQDTTFQLFPVLTVVEV